MAGFRIAEEAPPFSQSYQTIRESNNRCERPVLEAYICSQDRAAVGDYSTLAPIAVAKPLCRYVTIGAWATPARPNTR